MNGLEQKVPSLNTCLSLLARGITMMTVLVWARDDDGNFLVISVYGARPHRHVTPLCRNSISSGLMPRAWHCSTSPRDSPASCLRPRWPTTST